MAGRTGDAPSVQPVRWGTPAARWVIAATVLGSGIAFLDSTVVNVALPAIGRSLHAGVTGLQWTIDSYLITMCALMLLGGSLGDLYGRKRVFAIGLGAFGAASVLCMVSPTIGFLIAARAIQGIAGALLVPGSLSIISATFHDDDRSRAVGAWSGLAGVSSAVGPFLGGWLVDSGSWRYVFLINVPVSAIAVVIALRHVPESREEDMVTRHVDVPGALTATVGLAAASYALIESAHRFGPAQAAAVVVGVAGLAAFVVIERRHPQPMLPLELFRSRQFTGANLTTLAVYSGLGASTFLLVLELQIAMHYSALAAGLSLLPLTVLMLTLSARFGALSQRTGPRLPMTVGPLVVGAGLAMLALARPGDHYATAILPGAIVFGLGLSATVAPLTAAVLASIDEEHVGVGSAVNNAVARIAGLLAVAALPAIVGLRTDTAAALTSGYRTAMLIGAGLSAAGGVIAFFTIRRSRVVRPVLQPAMVHCCNSPELAREEGVA